MQEQALHMAAHENMTQYRTLLCCQALGFLLHTASIVTAGQIAHPHYEVVPLLQMMHLHRHSGALLLILHS